MLEHAPGSLDRVHQKQLTQSLPLHRTIHGQSAKADSGDLARQPFGEVRRKLFGQNLARSQGVVPENAQWRVVRGRNESLRDTTPLVLLRRLAQPGVKRLACALECVSVVATS